MKLCPLCNKTYDNTWRVCLHDRTELVDSEDTHQEIRSATVQKPKEKFDIKKFKTPVGLSVLLLALVILALNAIPAQGSGLRPDTIARLLEGLNIELVLLVWTMPFLIPLWLSAYIAKWYFLGYLISLIPFIKRHQRLSACIVFILGLFFIQSVYNDTWGKMAESNIYREVAKYGEIKTGRIIDFREHSNVKNKESDFRYISLHHDNSFKRIPRDEVWSQDSPTYKAGDIIATLHVKGLGYNQSSPNGTTLHNIKVRPFLKKYRPDLYDSQAFPASSVEESLNYVVTQNK